MSQVIKADYNEYTVRSAAVLTNSYVAGTTISAQNLEIQNNLTLLVDFTIGSLTSGEIKIEFSNDNTNWYSETVDAVNTSTGVVTEVPAIRTFAATGKFRIPNIKIMDKYVRVTAHGTGTVTSSSMAITALVGTN